MKTIKQELFLISAWGIAALIVLFIGIFGYGILSVYNESSSTLISDGSCNIAILPVVGDILPYAGADQYGTLNELPPSTNPDDFSAMLRNAEADPNIQGVMVRIDSGGGYPQAGESMMNNIKRSTIPTVSLIREIGASSAYLIATGGDTIIASPFSDVGGIGVTMSYLDNSEQNLKDGLKFVSLSAGLLKDAANPNKPLTYAERTVLERDLKIYYEQFIKEVAENRSISVEEVTKIADGSTMPGELALKNKLIDAIGDQETARAWFAKQLGKSSKEIIFCE